MIADIILVVFIVLIAFAGRGRGLFRSLMGLISFAAAIIISMVVAPPIASFIKTTSFYESLYRTVAETVGDKLLSGDSQSLLFLAGNALTQGVTAVTDAVASSILTIALSILLFVCISVLLRFLTRILDGVFKLPVLNFLNSAGGFVFGMAKAFIIVYMVLAIWGVFTLFAMPGPLSGSTLLSSMFRNNILLIAFK